MLIVNYPSNPTTATATLTEYGRLVEFARTHGLVLVSDLAYSELAYDGYTVPSVLQVPVRVKAVVPPLSVMPVICRLSVVAVE